MQKKTIRYDKQHFLYKYFLFISIIFLQEPHRQPSNGAAKRHVPITFENSGGSPNKQMRTSRTGENIKIYTPPSGKFSNNFSYGNISTNNLKLI